MNNPNIIEKVAVAIMKVVYPDHPNLELLTQEGWQEFKPEAQAALRCVLEELKPLKEKLERMTSITDVEHLLVVAKDSLYVLNSIEEQAGK